MRAIDLTGNRYGKLLVLNEAEHAPSGKRQWKCLCDCGGTTVVTGNALSQGRINSCGCTKRANIAGQKFGKLTAQKATPLRDRNGNVMWQCLCECGASIEVGVTALRLGKVTSCGCAMRSHLEGQRYGKLEVMAFAYMSKGRSYWECRCDCGSTCIVCQHELQSGDTKSCGCLMRELNSSRMSTHGMSKTRVYHIWKQMRQRCQNPNDSSYKDYGGIGVKVCAEWEDFETFYTWSMKAGYADDLSIDRIHVFRGYNPDNCKWATDDEQALNKRAVYYRLLRRYFEEHFAVCVQEVHRMAVRQFMEMCCPASFWAEVFRSVDFTLVDPRQAEVTHEFISEYMRAYLIFLDWAFSVYLREDDEPFDRASLNYHFDYTPDFDADHFLKQLYACFDKLTGNTED